MLGAGAFLQGMARAAVAALGGDPCWHHAVGITAAEPPPTGQVLWCKGSDFLGFCQEVGRFFFQSGLNNTSTMWPGASRNHRVIKHRVMLVSHISLKNTMFIP